MLGSIAPEHTIKAQEFVIPFKRWTVLPDILHCVAIRLGERPSRNPLRTANRSKRDGGSRLQRFGAEVHAICSILPLLAVF